MKILLLGFVRIAHMPYMHDYVSLLGDNHELHLVSWNRSGTPDAPTPSGITKSFVFRELIEDDDSLKKKLPLFFKYRKYVIPIIENEKYDKIIVLHSTPGITILDYLLSHYNGQYLLDYRDVSHERFGFYRRLIRSLSKGAGLVLASSPAYFKFLDNKNGIFLKHNLLREEKTEYLEHSNSPIIIRYWGMIRHEDANKALIVALGNDRRFEIHYNGREEHVARSLKSFCSERDVKNVTFHGEYYPSERRIFASQTHLLHNIYENDFATIGAMGNKYYDGLQFQLPQICTKDSIMGDLVSEKRLGIAIDYESETLADDLYCFYKKLNWEDFYKNADRELSRVLSDNSIADKEICDFIESNG